MSGNTGIGISPVQGAYPGTTLPGMSALGSSQSIAAKEEIERVDMRSSDFAPEYGDRPGGQILIETRSGSNAYHGDAFGYLRPQAFDSEDWFAQHYNTPLAAASLNGYGASLSGPIRPDRSFFFAAFEQAEVHDTALQTMATPSLSARAAASPFASFLQAFPSPIGPALSEDTALGVVPLYKVARLRNYSLRLDQALGSKARLFARLADTPSESATQQLGTANVKIASETATVGLSLQTGSWISDLRFNYSSATADSSWAAANDDAAGILSAISKSSGFSGPAVSAFSIPGVGQMLLGSGAVARQQQMESRYTLQKAAGKHEFHTGIDFIAIIPAITNFQSVPTASAVAPDVPALLDGEAMAMTYSGGHFQNANALLPIGSAFAQDTYKVRPRLTVLYGVRWEITHRSDSAYSTHFWVGSWYGPGSPVSPIGYSGAVNQALSGAADWPTRLDQIAPRLGLAYQLTPKLILRAGAGLFYDNSLGSLINPVNLSPLNTLQFAPGTTAGEPASNTFPHTVLFLPKVWEWRLAAERQLTVRSTLSVAYVGSSGTHQLREEATLQPGGELPNYFTFVSDGKSSYNALEVQLRGDIAPRLYAIVSYAWAHSIDNGSQLGAVFLAGPGFGAATDRGSSSFDIRHNVTASTAWNPHFLKGFTLSATASARTGFPFDVTTVDRSIGLGFANSNRPDLVPGMPLWIPDPSVPGGRQVNPRAFTAPSGEIGNLGRNVLTGPRLFQIDASVRRQFRLTDSLTLECNASAYNLFNHANFANPIAFLGSPLFGQPVSMQNLMLGSGTPNSGLTPIFQPGGPRTAEFDLKFSF
ncbi:MAG: TonB-dependent receptor [Acidobacteriia bacterium]|nr:TonB-dependent receptor [Terriglobia bacterium]